MRRVVASGACIISVIAFRAVHVNAAPANTVATPEGRSGHAMVYDRARECIVLFGGQGVSPLADTSLVIVSDVPVDCPWCPGLTLWRTPAADRAADSHHHDRSAKRVHLAPSGRGPLVELRPDEAIYELSVGERGNTLVIRTRAGRSDVVAQVGSSIR